MERMDDRYRCTKSFVIDKRDENECLVEGEGYQINEGSVWRKQEFSSFSDIRLENSNGWMEINTESLNEYFVKI